MHENLVADLKEHPSHLEGPKNISLHFNNNVRSKIRAQGTQANFSAVDLAYINDANPVHLDNVS